MGFQSTRPVRDATLAVRRGHKSRRGFNPRVPCGTRLPRTPEEVRDYRISIHASRAGRDFGPVFEYVEDEGFNPRVPCGTRHGYSAISSSSKVSIHASRAGRDPRPALPFSCRKGFNPRVPCGTRRGSALLVRRGQRVSIHASRAGRDPATMSARTIQPSFNPRVPCGTRQGKCPGTIPGL